MTTTFLELSEDAFDVLFPLLTNHLNPDATWAFNDSPGCLFGTSGDEFEFVRRQDPRAVWTLIDGDDGEQYVLSGCHYVNRIGYLVSTVLRPDGVDLEVRLGSVSSSDLCE